MTHEVNQGQPPSLEILAKFESSYISEIREAMPTKIGVHAFDINPYLHEFFESIPIDYIFLMTMDSPKGKFGHYWK